MNLPHNLFVSKINELPGFARAKPFITFTVVLWVLTRASSTSFLQRGHLPWRRSVPGAAAAVPNASRVCQVYKGVSVLLCPAQRHSPYSETPASASLCSPVGNLMHSCGISDGKGEKESVFQLRFMKKKIAVYVWGYVFWSFFLLKNLIITFTRCTVWSLWHCPFFPGENPTAKQRMFCLPQDYSKTTWL